MLRSLTLKNFRRHEDLTINFTAGLNALRGANEAGKSTILEAVLYALYGTKSLRDTLGETVTWGRKETDLKVELSIRINAVDYVFRRSKAGAEVWYEDSDKPKVVGQAEVSVFAAELVGADSKMASLLMLASQNGLRGALDNGPTAVSGLMGKLADFDLIDRIVETAQSRLTLGADAPLKQKLQAAEQEIEQAKAAMPSAEAEEHAEMLRATMAQQLGEVETHRVTVLQPALLAAEERYMAARQVREQRERLAGDASTLLRRRGEVESDIKAQQAIAATAPATETLDAKRAQIERERTQHTLIDAYNLVAGLPPHPETHWDEPYESFMKEEQRLHTRLAELRVQINGAHREISRQNGLRIISKTCPTCGALSITDEHVKQVNDAVDVEVKRLEGVVAAAQKEIDADITPMSAAMLQVLNSAAPFLTAKTKLQTLDVPKVIDESVFPPRITWAGDVPTSVDPEVAKRELRALEDLVRAAAQAQGRVEALRAQLDQIDADLRANGAAAQALPGDVDLQPLHDAAQRAGALHMEAQQRVETLKEQITQYERQRDEARRNREACELKLTLAERRRDEINADLKTLAFNNTLVTKLRRLKPMITDHLWNTVLSAVSNFFSQIRGEQSMVTKSAEGFKVNGRSIESLSGSTLDALAIAIRVALTKTFLPHATFIVLDEPAHGCDDERTGNVLGFLASVGFTQTILASHDELSEAVADNVIALGA